MRAALEQRAPLGYARAPMVEYEAKSWIGVVFRLNGSVLPNLLLRIFLCAAIGGGAAWTFHEFGFKMPPIAHTILGVALGLLLVFRTNASYDRYWEGRKLFGSIVNRSRDLARQAASFFPGAASASDRAEIVRLLTVFFLLLKQTLRGERDLQAVADHTTEAERALLEPVPVRPSLVIVWISRIVSGVARDGRMSPQELQLMDANLTSLVDSWGGCERILRTPIPFAYAQHIKSFLTLFCFTAPFAMVEQMKWYTPIAAAVLAFGMFGIDEIGVEIEDPFGYDPNDLPLEAIGNRIATDTKLMVDAAAPQ